MTTRSVSKLQLTAHFTSVINHLISFGIGGDSAPYAAGTRRLWGVCPGDGVPCAAGMRVLLGHSPFGDLDGGGADPVLVEKAADVAVEDVSLNYPVG